jgi:RNA polymerase sigma-70 factor (ECF subfamily)
LTRLSADRAGIDEAAPSPPVEQQLAFDAIYQEHFDFVFRTARRLGVLEASIDDVVQEVFLVLYRRRDAYDSRRPMRSWLYGILSNIVREHRRTRRRKELRLRSLDAEPTSFAAPASEEAGPVEHLERVEAAQLLFRMMEALDHDQREVLVLAELEQMSVAEISELVEVNVNTLYSRLKTAKKALASAYRRERARPPRGMP